MEVFVSALLALVALNVWMTRRVLRAGPALDQKGLLIAGLWIAPFIGALIVRNHLHHRLPPTPTELPPPPPHVEAPQHIEVPGQPALSVQACLRDAHGWLVFDWGMVNAWLDGIADAEQRQAARLTSQRAWLMHLRDGMGEYAWLHETDDVLLLSTEDPRGAKTTADFVARTQQRVTRVLGPLATPQPGSKSILVVFDHDEDYYTYTAAYDHGEGELAFSGGMFIDAGCPHFVTRSEDLSRIEPVIAHELTHAALAHLRLPLWLDEGIAVNTEHRLTGARHGEHTPQELQRMHQRFWGETEIQQFWTGESFRRPDDGNKLSYDLARIIVEQLAKTWEPFAAFVAQASRDDAGARAAREALGIELGAMVCALLQREPDPNWSPMRAPR
jgi:hypothetical protein